MGKQGVAISSAQAEALEHGVEYLTKACILSHHKDHPCLCSPLEQYALCASTLQHEGQQPVGFLFDLCMGCRAELRCTRNSCQT